jgi:hypothetical protein
VYKQRARAYQMQFEPQKSESARNGRWRAGAEAIRAEKGRKLDVVCVGGYADQAVAGLIT